MDDLLPEPCKNILAGPARLAKQRFRKVGLFMVNCGWAGEKGHVTYTASQARGCLFMTVSYELSPPYCVS